MRSALFAPLLVVACSLSLDESLIHDAGAGGVGGSHADGSLGGSGGTAGDASSTGGKDGSSGGTGGTPTGGTGGTPTGGSAGTGGTGAVGGSDGGNDAAGGSASATPGFADCGADQCDLATGYCCHDSVFDAGGGVACKATGTNCSGTKIQCDSAEDCTQGLICCLDTASHVTCTTSCPTGLPGQTQFCKADSECPAPKTCQPVSFLVQLYVPASYRSCQ